MDTILVLGLAGAAAVNSAVPGPCILVASSRAATDGLWSGFRVTFGVAASDVILLVLAWTMIVGVLTLPGATQEILRLGGLALLVILALAMLAAPEEAGAGSPAFGRFRLGDGALGLALGLSSPLNLLFMLALLPQFVEVHSLDAATISVATAAVLIGGALPILAACLFSARVLRTGRQMARRVSRLCGGALLGFAGLAVATPV